MVWVLNPGFYAIFTDSLLIKAFMLIMTFSNSLETLIYPLCYLQTSSLTSTLCSSIWFTFGFFINFLSSLVSFNVDLYSSFWPLEAITCSNFLLLFSKVELLFNVFFEVCSSCCCDRLDLEGGGPTTFTYVFGFIGLEEPSLSSLPWITRSSRCSCWDRWEDVALV